MIEINLFNFRILLYFNIMCRFFSLVFLGLLIRHVNEMSYMLHFSAITVFTYFFFVSAAAAFFFLPLFLIEEV